MSLAYLENILVDLKLANDNPRLYLTNYFSDLQNRIDIDCLRYANNFADCADKYLEHAERMINEIKQFEHQCLLNFNRTDQLDELVIRKVTRALSSSSVDNVNLKEISELLVDAMSAIQRQLFLNRGVLYLVNDKAELRAKNVHRFQTFGVVLVIDDEFISQFIFDLNWLVNIYIYIYIYTIY